MPRRKSSVKTIQIKKPTMRHVVKTTKSRTNIFKKEIIQYFDSNGFLSWSSKDKNTLFLEQILLKTAWFHVLNVN